MLEWSAVDDGSRVEIELSETVPARRRTRGSAVPPAAVSSAADLLADDDGGASPPRRSASRAPLVVTAAVSGLVMLALGWSIGRAGDGAPTAGPSTTAVTRTAPPTTALPGDSIAPATVPVPTAGPPSTGVVGPQPPAVLPQGWTTSEVEVHAELAGVTDTLVMLDGDSRLVQLDLATGQVRSVALDPPAVASVVTLVAGPDWTMFVGADATTEYLVDGASELRRSDIGALYSVFWQPGTDLFWRIDTSPVGGTTAQAVTLTGAEQGAAIDLGQLFAQGVDWGGGLIVADGGAGSFVVDRAGSIRLPGRVMASGERGWLVFRCGESIDSCGLALVERDGGAARDLPVDPDTAINPVSAFFLATQRPAISPDGRFALVASTSVDGSSVEAILDLDSGALTEMPGIGLSTSAEWSSDGRFVFMVGPTGPVAYLVETGETIEVASGFGTARAMTLRPASG